MSGLDEEMSPPVGLKEVLELFWSGSALLSLYVWGDLGTAGQ